MKVGMCRMEVTFLEEERDWRLPSLLYADDLVLCGELEEDLKMMIGYFVEVCNRSDLKVNANKSKMMDLDGEEELECEIRVDGARLEQVS